MYPVRRMLTAPKMRPEIPEELERMMESEPEGVNLDHLYEIEGHTSKGEFIRTAVREKVKRSRQKLD